MRRANYCGSQGPEDQTILMRTSLRTILPGAASRTALCLLTHRPATTPSHPRRSVHAAPPRPPAFSETALCAPARRPSLPASRATGSPPKSRHPTHAETPALYPRSITPPAASPSPAAVSTSGREARHRPALRQCDSHALQPSITRRCVLYPLTARRGLPASHPMPDPAALTPSALAAPRHHGHFLKP
jgi:hypothetical protein